MVAPSDTSSIHLLQNFDALSDDDASLPRATGLSLADLRLDSAPPAPSSSRQASGGDDATSFSQSVSTRSKQVSIKSPPIKSDTSLLNDEELLQFANNLELPATTTLERTSLSYNGSGTSRQHQPPNHFSDHDSYASPFQIPRDVFTTPHRSEPNAAYNLSKSYRLFIAPEDPNELNNYCFHGIGNSANFCINTNCKIKHNGEKFLVAPGEAFIKSNNKTAFMEPAVSSNFWEEDLITKWSQDSCTLSEWVERFGLVKTNMDTNLSKPTSSSMIDDEVEVKKTAFALQSTRKRKILPKSEPLPIHYSLGINLADPNVKNPSIDTISTCIIEMDSALQTIISQLNSVQKESLSQEVQNRMAFLQGEEKMKTC